MPQRLGRYVPIVLLVLAALPNVPLRAQTDPGNEPAWTTGWPQLGEATSLLLDPSHPSRLFAGTELGLATSTDGGRTWSLAPGTPRVLRALALDPSNPSRLVGGSNSGVFTSLDGGAHFTLSSSNDTLAIAIDPTRPETMYAAGGGNSVQKTTDGGITWTSSTVADSMTRSIAALIVDPTNHDNVFAGIGAWRYTDSYYYSGTSIDASLFGSHDEGQTWLVFLDNTGGAKPVRALAFDPRTSQILYAGHGPYVYRSANGGATWTPGTFALGSIVTSLAVDSLHPDTLYAGTNQGVFRSTDAGKNWAPLPILPSMDVRAIALDAPAQILHAATGYGVYDAALTGEAPSYPCQPSADSLCLLGGRFRVRARAADPRSGRFADGHAVGETDLFGYFSLPDFTGDPSLPEIIVKMVDAEVPPWNDDWVFFDGLTSVSYLITVTDTRTGASRSYQNDPTAPDCGGADTAAFPALPAAPASPAASPAAAAALPVVGDALSLLSGRYQIRMFATDPNTGLEIAGEAVGADDRFGYFSLPSLTGDSSMAEVFVKMIDARTYSDNFWIFGGSLTSLPARIVLEDMISGASKEYRVSQPFCGFADTGLPDSGPPPDGSGTYTVSGIVKDMSGPVAHAAVWIDLFPGVRHAVNADLHGRFSISGVPPGRWTLSAGIEAESGSVDIRVPPNVLNLTIQLIDQVD